MDRGAWQATVHGLARVRHDLMTKPPPSNLIKLLSSFLITLFIVINLCLYVGLLQFWAFSLFFFSFFPLPFFFNFFKPIIIFSTFIPLFAFPTALFPLQLIFNVYKVSLFTSI